MVKVETEDIWLINNNELDYRVAELTFDDTCVFINEHDTNGVLHVASGLQARDQIVFLRFSSDGENHDLPANRVGYLVSAVNTEDGSGILVSGERVEEHPKSYVNERIASAWKYLAGEGYTPDREFSLHALSNYLKAQRLINDQSTANQMSPTDQIIISKKSILPNA